MYTDVPSKQLRDLEDCLSVNDVLADEFLRKNKMTIKECVKGKVTFQYYRKGELYYRCENGLVFPVPIDDTGDASFNAEDKAMLFMRWIRKALENV